MCINASKESRGYFKHQYFMRVHNLNQPHMAWIIMSKLNLML